MNKIFEFERFPLSICTQEGDLSSKEEMINASIVEDDQGLVHFLPYVDPLKIYLSQHNNCVGETWRTHNELFADLVLKYETQQITEIAGGSGLVYENYVKNNENYKEWKVIDINPSLIYNNKKVKKIEGLYEDEQIEENDVVISSHFVEHIFDLEGFLKGLRSRKPKYHIFSLPNFKQFSNANYPATIMFEHPHYLPEECLDSILNKTGWEIVDKIYYRKHSIFYITQPSDLKENNDTFKDATDIIELIKYMKVRAENVKDKKFYVFGAHLTYYYLINMGINENQIIAVIDNDPHKQGKRMYGTNTKTISPHDMEEGANVFLEMGPYNEEIKKELNNIKNEINYI